MENRLAAQLTATELKSEYDRCAKRLIAQKVILAWILKSCASEFQDFSVEYIMEHCIEAEPQKTLLSTASTFPLSGETCYATPVSDWALLLPPLKGEVARRRRDGRVYKAEYGRFFCK